MYGFRRTKRVTDPLDDKVKARIIGRDKAEPDCVSSGSERSARVEDDVTLPGLSELFFGFSVEDGGESNNDSGSERDPSTMCDSSSRINVDMVKQIVADQTDEFNNALKIHVLKAVRVFSCVKSDKQITRRNVMAVLRNYGYNAAICKTKWESCGGLTAGSYEFIDVLAKDSSGTRYFVDLDFASEFQIARPTESYERLLRCLPAVLVGKIEDLKEILMAMSDAARRSLKSRGLHLPPWRKHRFMQNKWLGAHRRTENLFSAPFCPPSKSYGTVECRAVGFDAAVSGGRLLLPAAARTR